MCRDPDQGRRFGIGEGFQPPPPPPPLPLSFGCELCVISCPNNQALQSHLSGAKHKKKLAIANGENGEFGICINWVVAGESVARIQWLFCFRP